MNKLITELGTEVTSEQVLLGKEVHVLKPVQRKTQGRLRIRIREQEFVCAYVRSDCATTEHFVADCGDHFELMPAHATNWRPTP